MARTTLVDLSNLWKRCLLTRELNGFAAVALFREKTPCPGRCLGLMGDGTVKVQGHNRRYGTPLPMPKNFTGNWYTWLKKNHPTLFVPV